MAQSSVVHADADDAAVLAWLLYGLAARRRFGA
jgi:hypothetical protein